MRRDYHANPASPMLLADTPPAEPLSTSTAHPMANATPLRTELLPFTIRAVTSASDIERAARLRQSAYGRHLPEFAERLGEPEPADSYDNTVVLLAESKMDGEPLATLRIHTNYGAPLPLEQAVTLPPHLRNASLAEAVRLSIVPGREGHLPRDAIFKAFYLACLAMGIEWMVICARHPLHKIYSSLLFDDISPEKAFIPMAHIGDIPHRVMYFNVQNAESLWRVQRHPRFDFFVNTCHPDIENFSSSVQCSKMLTLRAVSMKSWRPDFVGVRN